MNYVQHKMKRERRFRIRNKTIKFTLLDICLALGLPVVGECVIVY